jgi:hypothetical protein
LLRKCPFTGQAITRQQPAKSNLLFNIPSDLGEK